jgi:hypothetical protein
MTFMATKSSPVISLLFALAGSLAGLAACHSVRQAAPAAQPIDWSANDSAHVALLETHGRRMVGRHVIILAPPDSLTVERQTALLDSLDRGVTELRRLIGPRSWQRIGNRPIKYYLVPERMISHASGKDVVFISMFHVNSGRAPYLHEAGHELLAPPPPFFYDEYPDTVRAEVEFQAMPYWLMEGLPDLLAQLAASAAGTREGDVFTIGGPARADSTCAARLAGNPFRADLLRVIGGKGPVDALFSTDRLKVAPAFYACAQSMSKYVVEIIGMEQAVEIFPAVKRGDWVATLERAAGMPLADLRARWRARLGVDST